VCCASQRLKKPTEPNIKIITLSSKIWLGVTNQWSPLLCASCSHGSMRLTDTSSCCWKSNIIWIGVAVRARDRWDGGGLEAHAARSFRDTQISLLDPCDQDCDYTPWKDRLCVGWRADGDQNAAVKHGTDRRVSSAVRNVGVVCRQARPALHWNSGRNNKLFSIRWDLEKEQQIGRLDL
jgi:hypothetical protein